MAYIEFKNVVKQFGKNTVLNEINLDINKGELVTLLGPSGCGKSTLLRCLSGLETVTSGQIILDGQNITNMLPASATSVCFPAIFPLSKYERGAEHRLRAENAETLRRRDREKVRDAIALVDLKGKEKSYPANLSGGQQQRVALARSIVTEPKVLLLDEPLSAIDAKLRKELQTRIREIHLELGLTTVFVTHDQDEAMVMSDVIELFHAGRIEQAGSPVSVYTKPVSTFAASFIGSYNQIDGTTFYQATRLPIEAGNTVAIRPETISISTEEPADKTGSIILRGTITASVPRGNVLRYTVQCDTMKLYVDTLFRSFNIYDIGSDVWLSIPEHDCLSIRGVEKEPAHV